MAAGKTNMKRAKLSSYGLVHKTASLGEIVNTDYNAVTTLGDNAIVAGVIYDSSTSTYKGGAQALNKNLVSTKLTQQINVYFSAATTIGDYALFGGGRPSNVSGGAKHIIYFNTSLVSTRTKDLNIARATCTAFTIGGYGIFIGGNTDSVVYDKYSASLVHSTGDFILSICNRPASTIIDKYAIISIGYSSYSRNYYKRYSLSDTFVGTSLTNVNGTVYGYCAATTIGNYALFGGGGNQIMKGSGTMFYSGLISITKQLTESYVGSLTWAHGSALMATSLDNYAIFAGGWTSATTSNNKATAINPSLVLSRAPDLNKEQAAGIYFTIGKYACFTEGYQSSQSRSAEVDVYYELT